MIDNYFSPSGGTCSFSSNMRFDTGPSKDKKIALKMKIKP